MKPVGESTMIQRLLLPVFIAAGSLACSQHHVSSDTPIRSLEDRLICQLVNGGPGLKMMAAEELRRLGSTRAVPYLLVEVRDKYGPIICEPVENPQESHERKCFVYRDGVKTPYVDYHAPLFHALSVLSVPYREPDKAWFEEIEQWIDENLLPQQRRLTPVCS